MAPPELSRVRKTYNLRMDRATRPRRRASRRISTRLMGMRAHVNFPTLDRFPSNRAPTRKRLVRALFAASYASVAPEGWYGVPVVVRCRSGTGLRF
ncbi:hypothetical protein FB451DRAFT_1414228 [Mycena latifolia]|nr:hypothetical protein FB451DRAFT_1414228 [Mycena latifolia]